MATDNLLQEFPPVSTQSWEDAIARDLKGADYARKLIWQTPEGLAVKPYYRAEDIAGMGFPDAAPGNSPDLRNTRLAGDWRIREEIDAADPEQANRAAQSAVAAGAEEIAFLNVALRNASDLGMLLLNLQEIPTHFQNAGEPFIRLLMGRLKERPNSALVSTGLNPFTNPDFAAEVIKAAPPRFIPFTIDGSLFEESGATAVEEVGFTLAAGVDFLAEMQSRGVEIDLAAAAISFSFAIGASYFFQIAKFRAFRTLWAQAVESFGGTLLSHVADPAAGSYCLEVITDFLAREGWKAMQQIESVGGYRKAVADGQVGAALQTSLAKRENAVIARRRVFTGTNQYADPSEKALHRVEPICLAGERRGAQSYESLRLRTERHAASTGKLPRVLIAEFGDVKMRSARSTFAANFFACAGFDIVAQRFSNVDEIAAHNADLIVLCSSDPEYLALATDLAPKLNALGRTTPVIVAGNPECAEQLRAAGVADFIHVKSNPIEVLTSWQLKLGIEA